MRCKAVHGAQGGACAVQVMDLGIRDLQACVQQHAGEDAVARDVRDVATALQHCHAQGVVHRCGSLTTPCIAALLPRGPPEPRPPSRRDVKAENALVGADGRVVLADFGAAALLGSSEQLEEFHGTIGAMSPETVCSPQAHWREELAARMGVAPRTHGAPTDAWSLGVLMCELLSGGVGPFERDTMGETLAAILIGEPPRY